jgi:kynurenine 3-monooxygenase
MIDSQQPTTNNPKHVTIIGAGLVGSLLSMYLAKRGYKVDIYEKRADMRSADYVGGRSINLALSHRGFKGLSAVGLDEKIRQTGIPMSGRTIHLANGDVAFQAYGKEDEAIYSVSRGGLNITLMDLAEKDPNITIHFNERCYDIDLNNSVAYFENMNSLDKKEIKSDLILSADGAFSAARLALQLKTDRFEYSQHYLQHGYKELTIPCGPGNTFLLEKNSLHIWPRNSYMLIALPNPDGNFTCTLFFPFEGDPSFASLKTKEEITAFFKKDFPDVLELIPNLAEEFSHNPVGSLVTVKCFPWAHKDKVGLLGDASHAIVPFFGQGMNAGFEDCFVLGELMEKHKDNWSKILPEFQTLRKPNADAIAEMAYENFIEMRDKVADQKFLLRKKIEQKISKKYPGKYVSKYSMVSFSTVPYTEALEMGYRQDALFAEVLEIPGIEQNWDTPESELKFDALLKKFSFI